MEFPGTGIRKSCRRNGKWINIEYDFFPEVYKEKLFY